MRKISSLLYNKYSLIFTREKYNNDIINNLITSKSSHLVSCLKESMIYDFVDEFLKRYYIKNESRDRIPKFVNYYKNYLKFFCRPIFRSFPLNDIIQSYGEKCAEIYYNDNYGKKKSKNESVTADSKKKKITNDLKIIFSNTIRENINNVSTSTIVTSNYNKKDENSSFLSSHSQISQTVIYGNKNNDNTFCTTNESLIDIVNNLSVNKKRIQLIAKPNPLMQNCLSPEKIDINPKLKYKLKGPSIHIKNSRSTQSKQLLTEENQKKTFTKISLDLIKITDTNGGICTTRKPISSNNIILASAKKENNTYRSTANNITQNQTSTSSGHCVEIKKTTQKTKIISRNINNNFFKDVKTVATPHKSITKLQKPIFSSFNHFDKQQQMLNKEKKIPKISNYSGKSIKRSNFGRLGAGIAVISNISNSPNGNIFRSTLTNMNTNTKHKKSKTGNITNGTVPVYKIIKYNGCVIKLK